MKKNMPKMNLTLAKTYVLNWEKYTKYFSKKALSSAIRKRYEFEFIKDEYTPLDCVMNSYYSKKGYPIVNRTPVTWTFKEYKGAWSRDVKKLCNVYRVPDSYQLGESKLLKDCLIYDFPYLKNYQFDCYKLNNNIDEIYIKTTEPNVSVYCPIEALSKRDPEIIKNRINTYWRSYYNTPERNEYLNKQLSILDSEFFKNLCKDVVNG